MPDRYQRWLEDPIAREILESFNLIGIELFEEVAVEIVLLNTGPLKTTRINQSIVNRLTGSFKRTSELRSDFTYKVLLHDETSFDYSSN